MRDVRLTTWQSEEEISRSRLRSGWAIFACRIAGTTTAIGFEGRVSLNLQIQERAAPKKEME